MTKTEDLIHCSKCGEKMKYNARRCPECKKANTTLNFKGLTWKIPLALIALGFLPFVFQTEENPPLCDSRTSTKTVIEAFNNGPLMKQVGLELIDITNIEETAYSEENLLRTCNAKAFTNGGETKIEYTLKARDDGAFWAEVRETF